jgi:hypothetical protein
MLADVAVAVQKTDFVAMKPIRALPDDIDYQLAADVVLEYLNRRKLVNTARCVAAEAPSTPQVAPRLLHRYLRVDRASALRSLIRGWSGECRAVVRRNADATRGIIAARLCRVTQPSKQIATRAAPPAPGSTGRDPKFEEIPFDPAEPIPPEPYGPRKRGHNAGSGGGLSEESDSVGSRKTNDYKEAPLWPSPFGSHDAVTEEGDMDVGSDSDSDT